MKRLFWSIMAFAVLGALALGFVVGMEKEPEMPLQIPAFSSGIDALDADGKTALMRAMFNPDLSAFDDLLKRGADIHAHAWAWEWRGESGNRKIFPSDGKVKNTTPTPRGSTSLRTGGGSLLMQLAPQILYPSNRDWVNVERLNDVIDRGADLNASDVEGQTVLMQTAATYRRRIDPAAEERGIAVVDCLVRRGADVNARNLRGETALMCLLSAECSTRLLEKLLEVGADPNLADGEGCTPLMRLVSISAKNNMHDVASQGRTALETWENGMTKSIDLLLKAGADVHATDARGRTALMYAGEAGCNLYVVRRLGEAGVDVNAKDSEGTGALMLGLASGRADADGLMWLLDHGIDAASLRDATNRAPDFTIYGGYCRNGGEPVSFYYKPYPSAFTEKLLTRGGWTQDEKNSFLLRSLDDIDKIELLVRHGADINVRDAKGRTLLMNRMDNTLFFTVPDVGFTARLLALGLDPNARMPDGNTFLTMDLPYRQTPEFMALLLQWGADACATDERGHTTLHVGRPAECVRMLIDAGADPDAVDMDGRSPLHTAWFYDPKALTELLREAVDVNRRDSAGRTPLLSWMLRGGYSDGVKLLLDAGADPVMADNAGDSPLTVAVQYTGERTFFSPSNQVPGWWNYGSCVRDLLAKGADSNAFDAGGRTALGLLLLQRTVVPNPDAPTHLRRWENIDLIETFTDALNALLDYGADVERRDRTGRTAWDYARGNTDRRVLQLLSKAVRTQQPDLQGRTTLMILAAESTSTSPLERALKDGKSVDARDANGWTALAHAAWSNPEPGIVRFLIARGADPNAPDRWGKTPLMWAAWNNSNPAVLRALLEGGAQVGRHDADGDNSVDIAIAHDRGERFFAILLEAGAQVTDRKRLASDMLLAAASITSRPEVVQLLLKGGADVNVCDANGQTPLMKAVSAASHPPVVRILLAAGADVNAKDTRDRSVLDYALNGNREVFLLLRNAGIRLDEKSVWWSERDKSLLIDHYPETWGQSRYE